MQCERTYKNRSLIKIETLRVIRFYASAVAYSGGNGGLLIISLLGREIAKLGHDTKLIPAQHVTPFVRGNKNDHNDAFAIAEASQRAHIRFVPVKSEHQQEISCLHRIRERLIKTKQQ